MEAVDLLSSLAACSNASFSEGKTRKPRGDVLISRSSDNVSTFLLTATTN